MPQNSAPNRKSFRAHFVRICARNKPEALTGNHFAQKRPKWARYFAHKWCSSRCEGLPASILERMF